MEASKPLPHHLAAGTLLRDRYRIKEVLGEGGFGITYKAWDETLLQRVAVKEYFPRALATRSTQVSDAVTVPENDRNTFTEGKARFLEEARTLARFLDDPDILSVIDFFEANGTAYLVMEFLDGEDLGTMLQRSGPMPYADAVSLLVPVLDALEKLHAAGLLHRDISPSNIRILPDGRVKLLDFGASRKMDLLGNRSVSILSKPGYSPVEQYQLHGAQGPWTDVYAIAATLYHMITGSAPLDSLQRVLLDELPKPSDLGAVLSPREEAVLLKALSVSPENRYQSVAELKKALLDRKTASVSPDAGREARLLRLTLLPVIGLLCPFLLAERSGQKKYRSAGIFFLILFDILFLLLFSVLLITEVVYYKVPYGSGAWIYWISNRELEIVLILSALFLAGYAARAVYVFSVGKDFLRYRTFFLQTHPVSQPVLERRKWHQWIPFFVPVFYGFSDIQTSDLAQKPGLKRLGKAELAVSLLWPGLFLFWIISDSISYYFYISRFDMAAALAAAFCFAGSGILYLWHGAGVLLHKSEILSLEQARQAELARTIPYYADRQWQKENTRWQIWTFFPFLSGIGLMLGGSRSKTRSVFRQGILLLLINLILFAGVVFLPALFPAFRAFRYSVRETIRQLVQGFSIYGALWIWGFGYFTGRKCRETVLSGIGKRLRGHYSFADLFISEKLKQ